MQLINVDINEFMQKLKTKKLVCFGAGAGLQMFSDRLGKAEFVEKIALILDNDTSKQNTKKELFGKSVDIISVETFCENFCVEDYIILITVVDAMTVWEQLEQIRKLEYVECCIRSFILGKTNELEEKRRYYPKNLRIYDTPRIPKVIHYCWFGGKEIPDQNKKWMESWEKYCPDYEIIEWNESNYDISKNRYMYEAYQAGKWGFVPDYARLDIIYHYGGIYLDTDVEVIQNLDELLYQDAFAGIDGSKTVSLGLGFGAKPGFQLFKDLMDDYSDKVFRLDDGTLNIVAAPTLQKPFFSKLGYLNNGEYQNIRGMSVYSEKMLSGKCAYTGMINPTKDTFLIHHYDGSWLSAESKNATVRMQELYKKVRNNQKQL